MSDIPGRRWLVSKFGGTSVSSAECWQTIAGQAAAELHKGRHVLIVVSALSGVTDLLEAASNAGTDAARAEILQQLSERHAGLYRDLELSPGPDFLRHWDSLETLCRRIDVDPPEADRAALLAMGERLSSAIGLQALRNNGLDATLQDATSMLETLESEPGSPLSSRCEANTDPLMEAELAAGGRLHITQGFLVAGPDGQTWLLGRGGSDTSAACLAVRLQAERLEIWTDVPGMFSADPRVVHEARLLQRLSYDEAQELASMGASVLHPPSVRIAQGGGVPLHIRDTSRPSMAGTRVGPRDAETEAQVKGVVSRHGVTLVTMEEAGMWRRAGFLADAFTVFKKHGLSVDLVSTSESSVTVSLDASHPQAGGRRRLEAFLQELSALCEVRVREGCVSISLVGNAIRTILGRLTEALTVFQDRKIHLVTQSANDLNLTLVVDPEHADQLVQKLHQELIAPQADLRPEFGPSWSELVRDSAAPSPAEWWRKGRERLLESLQGRSSAYVYDLATVRDAAHRLKSLRSVDRVLYAVKANSNPEVVRTIHAQGLGFDCVSIGEVRHVLAEVAGLHATEILFTPNFAARDEYREAMELGVTVTIDNLHPLENWPELFAGQDVFLRLDLDAGYGHHRKVITSGARSKFGIPLAQLDLLRSVLDRHHIRVTGLHAHTGSGVSTAEVWGEQLRKMLDALAWFPEAAVIDLGGGIGVPDHPGQPEFDLHRLDEVLAAMARPQGIQIWLEPGRYLVSAAGALLSRVTQVKNKDPHHYVGLDTGMNSLIRPALYGAWHEIVNLSRLEQAATHRYTVVGPICESGDVLGEGRFLPVSEEGDVILIANAGAYGRSMSSEYNLRSPAEELVLD